LSARFNSADTRFRWQMGNLVRYARIARLKLPWRAKHARSVGRNVPQLPPKTPKGDKHQIYPKEVVFDCPACKRRFPATDRKHTRNQEPPEICRFPFVEPDEEITCEGCIANRSFDHGSHTGDHRCQVPDPGTHGTRRTAGPHRDPAVPVTGTADQRNPLGLDLEFDRDPVAAPVRLSSLPGQQLGSSTDPVPSGVPEPRAPGAADAVPSREEMWALMSRPLPPASV